MSAKMMPAADPRCSFPSAGSVFYSRISKILFIRAKHNDSLVFTSRGMFVVRENLGSIATRMEKLGFARVKRSVVINLRHVVEIRRSERRGYVIVLSDATEIRIDPATRRTVDDLLSRFWIGER